MQDNLIQSYFDLGYDPIPLVPHTKWAVDKKWPDREPAQLWQTASTDANVALRCGGKRHLGVFDSDDKVKPTWPQIEAYLTGLGIRNYPRVRTPNGGFHAYVEILGELKGSRCALNQQVGSGDFRFNKGSYVVAPPSEINTGTYILDQGNLDYLPAVYIQDLLPIISYRTVRVDSPTTSSSITKNIPAKVRRILNGSMEGYETRSHADHAAICGLVGQGFTDDEIFQLFQQYGGTGKVIEEGRRWFDQSYDTAAAYVAANESKERAFLRQLRERVKGEIWPGRTGAVDHGVYVAHLDIAFRAGQHLYNASARELAELAGVEHQTASRATNRLVQSGLLGKVPAERESGLASLYQIPEKESLYDPYHNCKDMAHKETDLESVNMGHDLFSNRVGLGKAAGEIYNLMLRSDPMTFTEILKRSGKARQTIARSLERMADLPVVDIQTGEMKMMVEKDGKAWRANPGNLDTAASRLGVLGRGVRRKVAHQMEREYFHERLSSKGRRKV